MNAEKKAYYVRSCFNTIAADYDRMNLIMTWGLLPLWQRLVMKKTALRPGEIGLDVCCGTGEMTEQLAKRSGPFGEAFGLDFSEEMLAIAEAKRGDKPITYVQGDALDLPFADETFHAATSGFALRNVTDIPKAISEMARVVKPGGRVVVIEVSRPVFPLFKAFFSVYYYKVVPWLGKKLASKEHVAGSYEPYTWLAESLCGFPGRCTIAQYFKDAGLEHVRIRPVGFGATTIYSGQKPCEDEEQTLNISLFDRMMTLPLMLRDAFEDTKDNKKSGNL